MQIPETEIIVTKDGVELLRKTVRPGDYVIGREPECEVQIEAEQVAPRHAQLTVNFDHALIEDLGSDTGTLVNDQVVTEPTRLWPNQKIQVGSATVELRRVRTVPAPDMSLAPSTAAVKRLLPEEFLHEKKYDIGGVVAQGGMGAILNAREATTERTVAMKVMLDGSSPSDLVRFVAEAKVTAQLEHPNIVPVHELNVDENDQVFYTMKFVRGITLKKVLELMAGGAEATVKKYPLGALLTIFQKVCDAIAFAHSKGVIHRDLKPENIMLGDFGEVLVMDWGLAKTLGGTRFVAAPTPGKEVGADEAAPSSGDDPSASATMAGAIMGTPQYMAPEQARGEVETLDARSDIYALGAILYHLLALHPSILGVDAMAIVERVAEGRTDPLDVTKKRPHLPGGRIPDSMAAVVRKAMAFEPAARYPGVADLQADIAAYQNGFATSAEKAGAWKQFTLFVRRNKAASIGVAAVLVLGATLGTKAIVEGRRAEREAAVAKAALADLRQTAPTFQAQAKSLLDEGKFEEAVQKIGYAIKLDDTNAGYHLFRANLLEAVQHLGEAAGEYRRVLALQPDDPVAKTNLALCEQLLAESGGAGELNRPQQQKLLASLREQKRLVEAGPLNALLEPDAKIAEATLRARLKECQKQPGWMNDHVSRKPDGTFEVSLANMAIGDLSVLAGQPVSILRLQNSNASDLGAISKLPLRELSLNGSNVTDLSPLRGMALEILNLQNLPIMDLSPLKGMKLRSLRLDHTKVDDLGPLGGMPLELLSMFRAPVRDLSPLKGMPLVELNVRDTRVTGLAALSNTKTLKKLVIQQNQIKDLSALAGLRLTYFDATLVGISDLTPLRGQPLTFISLRDIKPPMDVSPLAECVDLEEILLPLNPQKVETLRHLPKVKLISTRSVAEHPAQTAEEFWKEYDAQAAGKK